MSDSNRVRVGYIKQVTAGVIPSSNVQTITTTGNSLKAVAGTTASAEIRTDGNMSGIIRTSFLSEGGINFELKHQALDDFFAGAWRSAFETPISLSGTTFSIDASGSPITFDDSGNGLGALQPNDIIMIQGFATAANNGAYSIGANVAAGSVDIVPIEGSRTPVTEAAGASVTGTTTRLQNANTDSLFAFEVFFEDVTQYFSFLDMQVDTLAIEFGAGAVPTVNIAFKGGNHPPIVATIGTGYDAAVSNEIIDADTGYLGTLLVNNGAVMSQVDGCVTKVSINIANSQRVEQNLNCTTLGKGYFDMKVNVDIVFKNQTYYNAYQNNGTSSLALAAIDGANQGIGITIPTMQYLDAAVPVSGANSTVIGSYQFQPKFSTVGSEVYTAIFSKLG